MRFRVGGYAAIGEQPHAVAQVGGVAHGVLDRELGGKPDDIQPADAARAQQVVQIGTAKGAVAGSSDEDFIRSRLEAVIRRRAPGAALERADAFGLLEQAAVAREVGIVRREHDVLMGNRPTRQPRRLQRAPAGVEKASGIACAAIERKGYPAPRMADVVLKMEREESV